MTCFLLVLWACSHKTVPAGSETAKTEKKVIQISYVRDVKMLVESKCTPCHLPNKGGFKKSLDNYQAMADNINDVIDRVERSTGDPKFMPFKHPPLSSAEIQMLKDWKAGGMKEN